MDLPFVQCFGVNTSKVPALCLSSQLPPTPTTFPQDRSSCTFPLLSAKGTAFLLCFHHPSEQNTAFPLCVHCRPSSSDHAFHRGLTRAACPHPEAQSMR